MNPIRLWGAVVDRAWVEQSVILAAALSIVYDIAITAILLVRKLVRPIVNSRLDYDIPHGVVEKRSSLLLASTWYSLQDYH